jgi:hypothetical protein
MQFAAFDSAEGRRTVAEKLRLFGTIIARQERIYRSYPLQTAESLLELWLLAVTVKPRSIFELGTGYRSSTIAFALAAAELQDCTVYGVDVAPREFAGFATRNYPELQFGPVLDTAIEATMFDIPDGWRRPILMFYDAHDGGIPGKAISRSAIARWFPRMAGQTVAIHDCARAPLPADDYLPQYVEATHWQGETLVGFPEIGPLVEWMNRERISFWRPRDELARIGVAIPESDTIVLTLPS